MASRIVFVTPGLAIGGAERSVIKASRLAADLGADVTIVVTGRGPHALALSSSVRTIFLNGGSSANPWLWLRLRSLLTYLRANVVVGWSLYANLLVLMISIAGAKWRTVISERNYFPQLINTARMSHFRRRLVLAAVSLLYPRADLITANSERNVSFLRRFLRMASKRVCHLPNYVDIAELHRLAADRAFTEPVLFGRASIRILGVGRLTEQKGFDVLLRAMAIVNQRIKGAQLVVLGDGPALGTLEQLACNLGITSQVRFERAVTNPYPYYLVADLVVLPSRYEGFPNVALEAMALARAVICSDCETGPRELTKGGRYGQLVPVDDVDALASQIVRLASDPTLRKNLGLSAQEHVAGTYSKEAVAGTYAAVIGTSAI